ncbi:MAG: hypothetical protein JWO37_2521 [Acidimicrobiales bacterium]|nr:hypothetical protein [Acidimicrobiales bacterium]
MVDEPEGEGDRREPTVAPRTYVALAVALLLAILVVTFILQNNDKVPVDFLWMHRQMRLGVALLISALIGGALAVLLNAGRRFQRSRRHR